MVFARSGSAWAIASRFLDAQRASFEVCAVKGLDGGFSLLSACKLHKTKATRVLAMRVAHDVCILDVAIFGKLLDEFVITNARSNSGDE